MRDPPSASTDPVRAQQSDIAALHVGVGAGADAASRAALADFFGGLRADTGAVYTVVLVGAPKERRACLDALRGVTDLPVVTVRDGMTCEPGSIHVVPARSVARLEAGRLVLSACTPGGSAPVDALFASMAVAAGAHTAAVVLSGEGGDGVVGTGAIKAAGGLVLVQAADDAAVPDMPLAALRTGVADFVLAAAALARQLGRYAAHPLVADTAGGALKGAPGGTSGAAPGERAGVDEQSLRHVFALLRERGRVDFAHYKSSALAACLERRMRARGAVDLDAYRALLESVPDETRTLERELLGNRTGFFRDADALVRLQRDILVPLVESDRAHSELRVWAVGCSTGQEAYSLAMLLDEAQVATGRRRRVKVFATDVDAEAIATAVHGRYPLGIRTDVSAERLRRHFTRVDDAFLLRTHIRQMVVFATHDVVSDTPFSHVDLVSCRNVLVHFRQDVQQRVLAGFHKALRPRGCLLLGSADGVGELGPHFEAVDERLGIFRQSSADGVPMSTSRSTSAPAEATASDGAAALPPVAGLLRHYRSTPRDGGFEHVRQTLLDERLPPCLVLDDAHCIVQAFGDAARYLGRRPRGGTSRDVNALVTPELSSALAGALDEARRAARASGRARVEAPGNVVAPGGGFDAATTVDLEVEYRVAHNGRPAWFAVLFHERGAERPSRLRAASAPPEALASD